MKRLLFVICILIPIVGYAQHPDEQKFMQSLENKRQQQNSKPRQSSNSSSNSGVRTATPATATNKAMSQSTETKRKGKVNAGADAWTTTENKSTTKNKVPDFGTPKKQPSQNSKEFIVDGKNAKGNSRGLSNGTPPGNVKLGIPTQEQIKQLNKDKIFATSALTEAQKRQTFLTAQYKSQCKAIERKVIESGNQLTERLVEDYIMRRNTGKPISPEAKSYINEIDMAVDIFKEKKQSDAEVSKWQGRLDKIEIECKGLCK